jgi:uncharacterized protein (TIGR00369 family)
MDELWGCYSGFESRARRIDNGRMTDSDDRTLVVTWEDPMIGASQIKDMTGLEYLQAMIAGSIPPPPIAKLMGFDLGEVEVGRAVFTVNPHEGHYNPIGTVHGGLVCTLLDSVAGCAAQTTLPKGMAYTSLEIKVSYLRPVLKDSGLLTAVGIVTKPGRRAAFVDATVTDAAGKLVATASSTLLIFPIE